MPEEVRGGQENQENKESDPLSVPDGEMGIDFVRSSGPGGQNVNKVATKAQLRWNVGDSRAFTEEQKELIRQAAGNRLNADDEIVLAAQSERSQSQNREEVVRRLQELVAEALGEKKERVATRVSRAEKQRRLEEKRRQGDKKRLRRPPKGEW